VNLGDEHYQPLFAYGYGLSVYEQQNMAAVSEVVDISVNQINDNRFLFAGDPVQPWRLVLNYEGGNTQVSANSQASFFQRCLFKPQTIKRKKTLFKRLGAVQQIYQYKVTPLI
jgi:hypothetical protein